MSSQHLLPVYARAPIAFVRGQGPFLYDEAGREYLDFSCGIGVTGLGHQHPALVEALCQQARNVWHTSNGYRILGQERVADRLAQLTFADRVFVTNSGVEAVECAIKVIRRYFNKKNSRRYRFICFNNAFHGRSMAGIAASGQQKMLDGFSPHLSGFDHVPFNDLEAVKRTISDETAAIMVEPIQGEGGVEAATDNFLKGLRQLSDEHGLLLCFDEIQCGMGRTGKLFAHEWYGVFPDVMTVAKALGGGFPVGACLMTENAAQPMIVGTHGTTYGGNPLAMAVANAVLDVMTSNGFLDHVRDMSHLFREELSLLIQRYPDILTSLHGKGLMCGLKVVPPVDQFVPWLRDQGLLSVKAGMNVVRLYPPLNIEPAQIQQAVSMIEAVCQHVRSNG